MTPFDLLFIFCVLAAAVSLVVAGVYFARGLTRRGAGVLARVAAGVCAYLLVLVVVSVLNPPRERALGERQCWDDWCAGAVASHRDGDRLLVTVRVSSRALRVTQRERNLNAIVMDAQGFRYWPANLSGPAFDQPIAPGQSFETSLLFRVPPSAEKLSLTFRHGGVNPGVLVIGDSESLLRKPVLFRL